MSPLTTLGNAGGRPPYTPARCCCRQQDNILSATPALRLVGQAAKAYWHCSPVVNYVLQAQDGLMQYGSFGGPSPYSIGGDGGASVRASSAPVFDLTAAQYHPVRAPLYTGSTPDTASPHSELRRTSRRSKPCSAPALLHPGSRTQPLPPLAVWEFSLSRMFSGPWTNGRSPCGLAWSCSR